MGFLSDTSSSNDLKIFSCYMTSLQIFLLFKSIHQIHIMSTNNSRKSFHTPLQGTRLAILIASLISCKIKIKKDPLIIMFRAWTQI